MKKKKVHKLNKPTKRKAAKMNLHKEDTKKKEEPKEEEEVKAPKVEHTLSQKTDKKEAETLLSPEKTISDRKEQLKKDYAGTTNEELAEARESGAFNSVHTPVDPVKKEETTGTFNRTHPTDGSYGFKKPDEMGTTKVPNKAIGTPKEKEGSVVFKDAAWKPEHQKHK